MEDLGIIFDQLKKTYSGKKVFLTGHTGFKGSWLLQVLDMLGANIVGYALPPQHTGDLYNLINGDALCKSVISDLRDKESLLNSITEFQPDFVFHLAAQPLVRLSYSNPSDTFDINVIGTANLLDGVRTLEGRCEVVSITTDKVYHNNEWEYPYREVDRLGGYDPYSASKACAELVIDSYKNSFFNLSQYNVHQKAIGVARAGNVIGGGDWSKDRLIPDIIKSLISTKEIEIRNPNSVRPWQHVLEPVIAYLILGMQLKNEPYKFSGAYNFGPYSADTLPVIDLVKMAINSWGSGAYTIPHLENQPHEAGLLKLDISKAINQLHWTPSLNAKEAITFTVDWYREYHNHIENIPVFTKKQIVDYLLKLNTIA